MTQKDLIEAVMSGKLVTVVEYRNFRADTIKVRADGKPTREIPIVEHSIEMGPESVKVAEFLPDGSSLAGVKQPFAKGAKCVLTVESIFREKGSAKVRGKLEAYAG